MPTFCTLAGSVPSEDLKWDGTDIWPVLAGKSSRDAHTLYWTAPGWRARAIRRGDWKLIVHGEGASAKSELFNLADDPGETTNLAAERPGIVTEFQKSLAKIAAADRDAVAKDGN
jgi:arylsulfatase A-like enzyme